MQDNRHIADGKKVYIEFLRIAAAFLVIVNHTNSRIFLSEQPSALWASSIAYFFASKVAVPVFIMIMGALLLEKQDSIKKYISRIMRIAVVTVVFTVLMHLIFDGNMSLSVLKKEILSSSRTPYWYLYLYLGLMMILPVMQKMAKAMEKRELLILLFVTLVIGGTVPMLEFVGIKVHEAFYYGLLSPYIGMAFAGYYIEKHLDINGKIAAAAALGFVILVAAQVAVSFKSYNTRNGVDYLWLDNPKFIPITASAICFYIIVKYVFENIKVSQSVSKLITYAGGLTFGIYLVSDCFIELLAPLYNGVLSALPVMVAMIIYEVAVFICSAFVVAVARLMPPVKKFI